MKKKVIFSIIAIVVIGMVAGLAIVGMKFLQHEKSQSEKIAFLMEENEYRKLQADALKADIVELQEEIEALKTADNVQYDDDAFNYFAIGNSITKHPLADYWWSESGMAASRIENDYVHLVSSYLEEKYGKCVAYAYCYLTWEVQGYDRAESYSLIEPYLSEKLDLVTIQMGENVIDYATFEDDLEALIKYISTKCPNAQIIVIDDYWQAENNRAEIKKAVAEKCQVPFADLSEIRGNSEYDCGLGTIIYEEDGTEHIVEHAGVSIHPGDKAMRYIADAVIELLEE